VRYLLRGYLRVRLRKLETHVMAILDDVEVSAAAQLKPTIISLPHEWTPSTFGVL